MTKIYNDGSLRRPRGNDEFLIIASDRGASGAATWRRWCAQLKIAANREIAARGAIAKARCDRGASRA